MTVEWLYVFVIHAPAARSHTLPLNGIVCHAIRLRAGMDELRADR